MSSGRRTDLEQRRHAPFAERQLDEAFAVALLDAVEGEFAHAAEDAFPRGAR